MNNVELKRKVWSTAGDILKEKNYISSVDMLMKMGVLSYKDYENWRFNRIPYLEKVCKTNLHKLSLRSLAANIITEIKREDKDYGI